MVRGWYMYDPGGGIRVGTYKDSFDLTQEKKEKGLGK